MPRLLMRALCLGGMWMMAGCGGPGTAVDAQDLSLSARPEPAITLTRVYAARPAYVDTITIDEDGNWRKARTYLYGSPARNRVSSGHIPPTIVRTLVNGALGNATFMALPETLPQDRRPDHQDTLIIRSGGRTKTVRSGTGSAAFSQVSDQIRQAIP